MLDLSLAIFIFGLTVPFSLSSPIANTACPKSAVQSTVNSSICYLYVNQTLQGDDAENFCAQSYIGGHVASITNAYENAFIFNYIKNLTTDYVWLGAFSVSYYEDLNFEWVWYDERKFSYYNVERYGEVNPDDDELSIFISSKNGKWDSQKMQNLLTFICEIPLSS